MLKYQKLVKLCLIYTIFMKKNSDCCIITTLFIPYFTVFFEIFEYVKKNSQFQIKYYE